MEAQEEVMGSTKLGHTLIIKGRRAKRQRPPSPLELAMASSSSSAAEGGGDGGVSDNYHGYDLATASPTTSTEFTESTEEEEDMANCLILLAQGQSRKLSKPAAASTTSNPAGFCVYQCKTCNRCFPSFQALGGHRASHKKPKAILEEKKALALKEEEEDLFNNSSKTLSLQIANRVLCSNNKPKVHECSVCGAEFSSGQALGGHMRRHRTFASTATTTMSTIATSSPECQEAKKPRNILPLDLNLPAPEDDHRESKFPFTSKEQALIFTTSPLVDCHY